MKFYTYKITNILDGKYYYGAHSTNDLNDGYFGSGLYLRRAINRHGKNNFSKVILAFHESKFEMYAAEKGLVDLNEVNNPKCYNVKIGGKGGWGSRKGIQHSEESKLKMRASKKGRTKENHSGCLAQSMKTKGRTRLEHSYIDETAIKLKGRTKSTHKYLKESSDKLKGRTKDSHIGLLISSIKKSIFLFITPIGNFYNAGEAEKSSNISGALIHSACKEGRYKIFSKRHYTTNIGLNILGSSLYESEIGKTFEQLGFKLIKLPDSLEDRVYVCNLFGVDNINAIIPFEAL